MRRRQFIAALGSAPAWPMVAHGQQTSRPVRIGFLFFGSESNTYDQSLIRGFRAGLAQVGLVEDRDVVLDLLWVGDNPDQAVAEVMRRGAEILVPCGSAISVAAKRQAPTTPIVFLMVGNPIAMGLVESLPHPGGNATGFSDITTDLSGKLVDIARDLSKPQTTIHYLWYTGWPDGQNRYEATEHAAREAGLKVRSRGIADIAEIDGVIANVKREGATALIIQPSPFTYKNRSLLIASTMNHGVGMISGGTATAREGALIGYGPDFLHMFRRAPIYVKEVLKGTKPADLPVELPTKVEMVVNLKTAKALGIELPVSFLVRADEIIE
jgi:putative tryptophan/tyrosine transport system substrate-binding protein